MLDKILGSEIAMKIMLHLVHYNEIYPSAVANDYEITLSAVQNTESDDLRMRQGDNNFSAFNFYMKLFYWRFNFCDFGTNKYSFFGSFPSSFYMKYHVNFA